MSRIDPSTVEALRAEARARIADRPSSSPSPVGRPAVKHCASCSAAIWWRLNPNGKPQPMNYNLVTGTPLQESHFVTCPERDKWRKRTPRPTEATPGLFAP